MATPRCKPWSVALRFDPTSAGPVVEYYVSDSPPCYLGHRRGTLDDDGQFVVTRESVMLDFETLTVAPQRRLDALLDIRREILDGGSQVLWWDPTPSELGN